MLCVGCGFMFLCLLFMFIWKEKKCLFGEEPKENILLLPCSKRASEIPLLCSDQIVIIFLLFLLRLLLVLVCIISSTLRYKVIATRSLSKVRF